LHGFAFADMFSRPTDTTLPNGGSRLNRSIHVSASFENPNRLALQGTHKSMQGIVQQVFYDEAL
jgi:hypothetical protein